MARNEYTEYDKNPYVSNYSFNLLSAIENLSDSKYLLISLSRIPIHKWRVNISLHRLIGAFLLLHLLQLH
jgi:hypothetical protein